MIRTGLMIYVLLTAGMIQAQPGPYPKNYFRNPLNIPMQLVANFGEIRTNHWHMGLDIRTQQRENLQVFASAEGYVSRVSVAPGGFGLAIYINHPNGLTTLYAHMNAFFPALAQYVTQQQYSRESWAIDLDLPATLFPVRKGQYIGLSGNTGGSQGPHVHFEIRDTRTGNCLNPLLFGFPIADKVPPSLSRLVMYDRNRSTFHQLPQPVPIRRSGNSYVATAGTVVTGSSRVSFAVGAVDRFSGSNNPNGIFGGKIYLDNELRSHFELDDISYNETRYMNAQIDYRYHAAGGAFVQHLSRLPGDTTDLYRPKDSDGVLHLPDTAPHDVRIEISDAAGNVSTIRFSIRYNPNLNKPYPVPEEMQFLPGNVNIYERDGFELFTTEISLYDTVNVSFSSDNTITGSSISPLFTFLNATIPVHDEVMVRIRPTQNIPAEWANRIIIRNVSGKRITVRKAAWQKGYVAAGFRQFGTFQAFLDTEPPSVNNVPSNLGKASRIVLTPTDNFREIAYFRAELDGKWLMFSNDKGRNFIYRFDERFPRGTHELKVTIRDVAGNETVRTWQVTR